MWQEFCRRIQSQHGNHVDSTKSLSCLLKLIFPSTISFSDFVVPLNIPPAVSLWLEKKFMPPPPRPRAHLVKFYHVSLNPRMEIFARTVRLSPLSLPRLSSGRIHSSASVGWTPRSLFSPRSPKARMKGYTRVGSCAERRKLILGKGKTAGRWLKEMVEGTWWQRLAAEGRSGGQRKPVLSPPALREAGLLSGGPGRISQPRIPGRRSPGLCTSTRTGKKS